MPRNNMHKSWGYCEQSIFRLYHRLPCYNCLLYIELTCDEVTILDSRMSRIRHIHHIPRRAISKVFFYAVSDPIQLAFS